MEGWIRPLLYCSVLRLLLTPFYKRGRSMSLTFVVSSYFHRSVKNFKALQDLSRKLVSGLRNSAAYSVVWAMQAARRALWRRRCRQQGATSAALIVTHVYARLITKIHNTCCKILRRLRFKVHFISAKCCTPSGDERCRDQRSIRLSD